MLRFKQLFLITLCLLIGCVEEITPGTSEVEFAASTLSGDAPLEVQFRVIGDTDVSPLRWNFGDGTKGEGKEVAHVFETFGDYTVTLSSSSDKGLQALASKTVKVNGLPEARFTTSAKAWSLEVSFDASQSLDPEGAIDDYNWEFGDGTEGSGQTVSHSFAETGSYDVTLTVTDANGAEASVTQTLTIEPKPVLEPISVSSNGRYLLKGDEPFFWHADSAWQIWKTTERGELDIYLDDAVEKGFTVIQVFLTSIFPAPGEGNATPNGENEFGDMPFIDNDPTKLNPAYFDYAKYVINEIAERGLYTAIMYGEPARYNNHIKSNQPVIPYRLETKEEGYDYAYAVGEYFRDETLRNNIIWFNGQDRNPDRDLGEDVWLALNEGLADGVNGAKAFDGQADYSTTLMSYHENGLWKLFEPYFATEPWLDFFGLNNYQHYDAIVENIEARYASEPTKPVVCIEQAYEDRVYEREKKTDWHVRFQAYWCYLSGATGYAYGHYTGYHVADSQFWPEYFDFEGRMDMAHIKTAITSRPLEKRIPDQSLIVSNPRKPDKDKDYIAAARADDGSYAFIYSTNGRAFSVDLTKLSGAQVQAQWFDPREGVFEDLGVFQRSAEQVFTPPGEVGPDNDWLLIIDALE